MQVSVETVLNLAKWRLNKELLGYKDTEADSFYCQEREFCK